MLLFDFECMVCGTIFEKLIAQEETVKCVCCPGEARKIFTPTKFYPFHSYTEGNLGDVPVDISSWKQLDRECEKRGLSHHVGPVKYSRRRRLKDAIKERVRSKDNFNQHP